MILLLIVITVGSLLILSLVRVVVRDALKGREERRRQRAYAEHVAQARMATAARIAKQKADAAAASARISAQRAAQAPQMVPIMPAQRGELTNTIDRLEQSARFARIDGVPQALPVERSAKGTCPPPVSTARPSGARLPGLPPPRPSIPPPVLPRAVPPPIPRRR